MDEVSTLASRRLKVLRSTSASQIDSFERCERIWANNYLFGLRADSTPAQKRGTTIDDDYVQPYLKSGSFVDGEWKDLVKALVPFLPAPSPQLLIQHRIDLSTFEGGPNCVGFIDFAEEKEPGHVEVGDLKTTSDFRYCKTEEQLADNTQMITYARWAYEALDVSKVSISHVYARTRGAKKGHKVGPVYVSRDLVAERWGRRVETVKRMVVAAKMIASAEELPPDTSRCDDYGGCPFKAKCGFIATTDKSEGVFSMMTNGKGTLSDRLMTAKKRKGLTSLDPAPDQTESTKVASIFAKRKAAPVEVVDDSELDQARAKILAGTLRRNGDQVQDREGADNGWILREPTEVEKIALASTASPDSVLPSDAPSRTSTLEEVEEVVEAKKRGRPKKNKNTTMKLRVDGVLYLCEIDAEGNEVSRTLAEPSAPAPAPAPAPEVVELSPDAKLLAAGFTVEEIARLQNEDAIEEALAGKITVGTMRQPSPIKKTEIMKPVEKKTETVKPVETSKGDNGAKLAEILKEKRVEPRKAPLTPPVLFIDCGPTKNTGKTEAPVPLADWLGPIAEIAALAHDVTDYRLISYTSKGVLATAIQSCIDTCPPALLIDSSAPGADEVIAALTPHASLVIRRFQ